MEGEEDEESAGSRMENMGGGAPPDKSLARGGELEGEEGEESAGRRVGVQGWRIWGTMRVSKPKGLEDGVGRGGGEQGKERC